jgi:hypothetical protein
LYVTLRFEVPGLHGCKVILAWANLRLPAKGNSPAIAKPIDDRDSSTIVSAGVITEIDDEAIKVLEITANLVQSGNQSPLFNVFQLEDPKVTKGTRPAIMKHPGLGLFRPPETIGDKRLFGCFEELLDLSVCEFLPESGLRLCGEVSFLPIPTCFGLQHDMPVIQRVEHLAEDIEEFIVTGLPCDFGSVGVILLVPVNIPQFEKWIPVAKGLPELFEILFRVAIDHGSVDLSSAPLREESSIITAIHL